MGRFRWMLSATVVSRSGTSWLNCRRRCRRCCDRYYLFVSFVFWIEFSIITIKTGGKGEQWPPSQRTTESYFMRIIRQNEPTHRRDQQFKIRRARRITFIVLFSACKLLSWRDRHMQCVRAILGYVCSECDGNLLQSIRAVRSAINSNTRAFNL